MLVDQFNWSSNGMTGDLGYRNGNEGSLRVLFLQSLGLMGMKVNWSSSTSPRPRLIGIKYN
jgi:hypothetical protein